MLFAVISLLVLIYAASIPAINRHRLSKPATRVLRIVNYMLMLALAVVLFAADYNIYPRWYWFTKVLFWLTFFSCMLMYGVAPKKLLKRIERIFYGIIFYSPAVFVISFVVPLIGFVFGMILYVNFIGDSSFILYNDNRIRIEKPYIRFLGPDPRPVIYVKQGLTAYKDTELPTGYDDRKDTIIVKRVSDNSYVIVVKSPDNWQLATGEETIHYTIGEKK